MKNLPSYEEVFSDIPESIREKSEEEPLDPFYELLYKTYTKIQFFLGWDYDKFLITPWEVIEYLIKDIDERLSTIPRPKHSSSGKGITPINSFHLALILALNSLFGESSE